MPAASHLQIAQYESDGYLICEQLFPDTEMEALSSRMAEVAAGSVCAFPPEAIEFEPGSDGVCREATVRKINHCAQYDDLFMAHAASARVLDIVESLIGPDIKLFGSQCFMKPPGGIEKPYHQDSAYFSIEPAALVTCWTAIDDATVENGCLAFIPGSHQGEILAHDQPWDIGDRIDMRIRNDQIDHDREVYIELKRGSCSFHHSKLLHRSGTNQTNKARRGLAVHYMSARSRWTDPTKAMPTYKLLRGREYDGCV